MPGYVGDPVSPNTSSSEFDFVPFSASSPAATGRNSLISCVISSMLFSIQMIDFFYKCSPFFFICVESLISHVYFLLQCPNDAYIFLDRKISDFGGILGFGKW